MIDRMRALLKEMDMCVLATSHQDRPHCSLMAYVPDDEGRRIYMITKRGTKKYQYLLENPQVSLLIDTRCEEKTMDREKVEALTVYGFFEPCEEPGERNAWLRRLVETHPHLKELVEQPDAEVLRSAWIRSCYWKEFRRRTRIRSESLHSRTPPRGYRHARKPIQKTSRPS